MNAPNLVSHITQRAAGKEPLFLEESDYLFMLGHLKETVQKCSLDVYAFCLMPNHIHLLLSPREENLYDAMRDLFAKYAMKFNYKYERKGHLFGGPYRQAVCWDDSYLLAASLYIHRKPVEAGLALDPMDYRWSSSRLYCEDGAPKSFVNPDFVLALLSRDKVERKERYRTMLKQGPELDAGNVLEEEDAIERFRSKLASMFSSIFEKVEERKQITRVSGIDLLGLEEIDRKLRGIKEDSFPNKPESRKAEKYLIEQLIARGYKRTEIAERLGISRKTVYNILKSSP